MAVWLSSVVMDGLDKILSYAFLFQCIELGGEQQTAGLDNHAQGKTGTGNRGAVTNQPENSKPRRTTDLPDPWRSMPMPSLVLGVTQ